MTIEGSHGSGRKEPRLTAAHLIEAGTANREVVQDLLEAMRAAWEKILNDYAESRELKTARGGVRYIDAQMAVHNFHKLAIGHIVDEAELKGEAAAQLYLGAGATFMRAMQIRADGARLQK